MPPSSFGYPNATNTFVPSHEATGGMIVGFSRNAKDFKVNTYSQIIPVTKQVGLYMEWLSQDAARVLTTDDREHLWPDGADAPHGNDELEAFGYDSYTTVRRVYPFTIGNLAIEQASFPIVVAHSKAKAQKAMTVRTMLALDALNSASWGANTKAVKGTTGLSGSASGGWDVGTPTAPYIKMSLNYAARAITQQTIGAVDPQNDAIVVVSPALASKMAESQEVHTYIKESQWAYPYMMGDLPNPNLSYGLPPKLYGYTIVVENTVRISTAKGATTTYGWAMPNDTAYMLSRPGDLVGLEGAPSYSTLIGFFYQDEMTVKIKNDPDNERTSGRIISNYQYKVASVKSGFKFTAVTNTAISGV